MLKRSLSAFIAVSTVGLTSLDAQAISLGEFEYQEQLRPMPWSVW